MARVVVLGAGISGHTAALHLRRLLDKQHEVVVVSPNSQWNWIPSNIWVGVGRMKPAQVTFPLAPVYDKKGIDFRQAKAVALHPEGDDARPKGYVDIVLHRRRSEAGETRAASSTTTSSTRPARSSTSPRRRASARTATPCRSAPTATPRRPPRQLARRDRQAQGGPAADASSSASATAPARARARRSSTPSTSSTSCATAGVRDLAEIVYLTNEYELGDFGVGGLTFKQNGFVTTQPALDRVAVQGARRQVDPARARAEDRGGPPLLRDPRRRPRTRSTSTSPCCCRRSAAQDLQAFDQRRHRHHRRGVRPERLPQGRRRLHRRSRSRSGRRQDWPSTYVEPGVRRTSSASASRSRRRTRSPRRARPQRHGHHARTAAHRHAVRAHGPRGAPRASPT